LEFFRNASPLRKSLFGLGAVTFVAGAVLLVIGGMAALGGGDEERNDDVPFVALTPRPSPTPAPTDAVTATPAPTPVPTPPLNEAGYTMVIDKIGVNNPVAVYGLDANAVPVIPTDENAGVTVAWYDFSARPGTGSNAVFAGHVTWFGSAVFYNLADVVAGDDIKLRGDDGTELLYKVSEVFRVDPNDPNSLNVMKATDSDMITIITCDGVFTPDPSDHVSGGGYDQRLVVRATLDSITPAAAVAAGG
jgi:LPXTG-site transpeptidase (sortase) family protein